MIKKEKILLVGAGPMGIEYAKVLSALQMMPIVVGRSEKSVKKFTEATGMEAATGGIEKWLKSNKNVPTKTIVAVTEDQLGVVTRRLIDAGVKEILVEKPGGLNVADIKKSEKKAKIKRTKVYVGYNRRFYASVRKALEIIQKEGGVRSFIFEFTEWSHVIAPLAKAPEVKREWFLLNSTHLIDLAFFIGGKPKKISCYKKGKLDWHPKGSIYSGAGITKSGALFSYHANWESAGRWWIEILTPKSRLIFRPLEKLQIQKMGRVAINEAPIDDRLDQNFKPGLFKEVESFLTDKKYLPTIEQQVKNLSFYLKINK